MTAARLRAAAAVLRDLRDVALAVPGFVLDSINRRVMDMHEPYEIEPDVYICTFCGHRSDYVLAPCSEYVAAAERIGHRAA